MSSAADVFISYARQDFETARRISRTLSHYQLVPWWDDRIELSRQWDRDIIENLSAAKSVLVVWSRESVASDWVNREASSACSEGKLIQLRIEAVPLPEPFQSLQAADLFTWERNTLPRGIRRVINEIAVRCGKNPPLKEYSDILELKISSDKIDKFIDEKKHYEKYFPKLGNTLYADFWEMMRDGNVKLYDELRPSSRHNLSEERYYELVEYLSYDRPTA